MKKLFAIVMVLAMALAIAAPALASGWDALPTTTPTFKDITIKITALETEPNETVLGSLYEKVAVMYPVVKGTLVHFYVEITIPKLAERSKETVALLANKGLVYKLSLTNLVTVKGENTSAGNSVNYFVNGTLDATHTLGLDAKTDTKTFGVGGVTVPDTKVVYGFEYWAAGVAAGKDGVAAATIGFYNTWAGNVFGWDNDADGINEFMVVKTPNSFIINKGTTYPSANFFTFPVDGDKIDVTTAMVMGYQGTSGPAKVYTITRSVNGDITFQDWAPPFDVITPADTATYPALKAAFDSYFAALGFGYPDAKFMTTDHFTTYFGTIMETTVKIVYPSGAVVVAPPAVEPPQTGDANTVVGFVMIALALVAAAAVTVKKVRA